jgi:hypothetical protein
MGREPGRAIGRIRRHRPGNEQARSEEIDPLENEIIFFKNTGCQGEHRMYADGEDLPISAASVLGLHRKLE